ncbi:MAG: rhombotarget lipoprotein [Betaproteobacteria bacterium]|nr:rhombotarget lipoprotein [Betaproteobacteria bacterium]
MKIALSLLLFAALAITGGCATPRSGETKQSASIVDYLYPASSSAPKMEPGMALLRPPVRVGLAFVPADAKARTLPEAEKMKLLERTKAAFARQPYVGALEIIPTQYLKSGGGFENLQQVSRLFNVDIMAMVSYDQVHFSDSNSLSFLYWTIIGAYVVNGNEFDIKTMLDISVFDIASRKLLFHAPGTSQINGGSNWASYSEKARSAQIEGYQKAVDQLIPKLNTEIELFRVRLKEAADIKLEPQPGYKVGEVRR